MHVYKYLTVYFLICISTVEEINCASYCSRPGAREAGMAGSSVALNGIWSICYNPAGIALSPYAEFAMAYENHYFLPELSATSFAFVIPVSSGAFGMSAGYSGTSSFNNQKFALGYAHKFGSNIQAGVLLDYYSANLPAEYETARTIAGEIGILTRPTEKLSIGVHLNNITGSSYTVYPNEKIPVLFSAGAAWQDERYTVCTQVELNSNEKARISAGTEVILVKDLAVRAGISNSDQMSYTVGLGYALNRIICDIAFSHHPILGFSSSVSIQVSLSKQTR
jgi:hypothetical protein